jgi:hypothetical protein
VVRCRRSPGLRILAGRQKDVQPPAGVRSGAAVAKVAYERSVGRKIRARRNKKGQKRPLFFRLARIFRPSSRQTAPQPVLSWRLRGPGCRARSGPFRASSTPTHGETLAGQQSMPRTATRAVDRVFRSRASGLGRKLDVLPGCGGRREPRRRAAARARAEVVPPTGFEPVLPP